MPGCRAAGALHILAGAVTPDGTQLADERESLLWGFVNALHAQVQRLDRDIDKIAPEMKDLQREQDGSEIKSCELERLTDEVQNLGDRRDAFEAMRDLAAEGYRAETGDTWRPRNGSHSSQTMAYGKTIGRMSGRTEVDPPVKRRARWVISVRRRTTTRWPASRGMYGAPPSAGVMPRR